MPLRPGDTLAQRYHIGERLGTGSAARTFAAREVGTAREVVIKELTLSTLEEWKPYDLFEREAKALANLRHARIPALIEYFQQDDPQDRRLYLVMARVPGQTLAAKLTDGWHPTEAEVRAIALDVLAILEYLQSLQPPVVHRDLKPSNLIMDDQGRVHLVDFGAVQDAVRPRGGSTVVGTFGYMAPEQFAGRAVPASDLYGLGATLAHILSGMPPSQMQQKDLQLDFRPYVSCSRALADWVEGLLTPAVERRFSSAHQARRALEGQGTTPRHPVASHPPHDTRVKLHRDAHHLSIEIPPLGWRMSRPGPWLMSLMGGSMTTSAILVAFFLIPTTITAQRMQAIKEMQIQEMIEREEQGQPESARAATARQRGQPGWDVSFRYDGTSLPSGLLLGGVGVVMLGLGQALLKKRTRLRFDGDRFSLSKGWWGFEWKQEGRTASILKNPLAGVYRGKWGIKLHAGAREHQFGEWLSDMEQEWLVAEIRDFLVAERT